MVFRNNCNVIIVRIDQDLANHLLRQKFATLRDFLLYRFSWVLEKGDLKYLTEVKNYNSFNITLKFNVNKVELLLMTMLKFQMLTLKEKKSYTFLNDKRFNYTNHLNAGFEISKYVVLCFSILSKCKVCFILFFLKKNWNLFT